MNKTGKWVRIFMGGRMMIPIGIFLIVVALFSYRAADRSKDFIHTEGTVTSAELYEEAYVDSDNSYHDATYTVVVKYVANGREYESELGVLPDTHVGDTLEITYNPNDPTDLTTPEGFLFPILIGAAGMINLIIGIVLTVRTYRKETEAEEEEPFWQQ